MVVTPTLLKFDKASKAWKPLKQQGEYLHIEVLREANRIPSAQIQIVDGNLATQTFQNSNSPHFAPGESLQIQFRVEGNSRSTFTVFEGVIVRHYLEANQNGIKLSLELSDHAISLTRSRKSQVYKGKSDDSIIDDILKQSAAVLKKGNTPWEKSKVKHQEMVQYYCSDWDFIISRAEANGWLVLVDNGVFHTMPIGKGRGKAVSLNIPLTEIYDFEMEADAGNQYEKVSTATWNINTSNLGAEKKEVDRLPVESRQGNLTAKQLARALGNETNQLQSVVNMPSGERDAWVASALARAKASLLKGRISLEGKAEWKDIQLGTPLEIKGVGDRFSGTAIVTAIRHTLGQHGWRIDLQFGLDSKGFSEKMKDIMSPPAAGLLPGIGGLQVGIVKEIRTDKNKQALVMVEIPAFGAQSSMITARMSGPYAGSGHGFLFLPEVEDEVLLGFINDDPRHAVILGGMYSSGKNQSPQELQNITPQNPTKGIVTANGIKILFQDKKGDNKVEIKDGHGNAITMDASGISIVSVADFKVDAGSGGVELVGSSIDLL